MRLISLLVVLVSFAGSAFAAGGGDPHAIPWKTVGVQVFNFSILICLLVYFLKQTVREHFSLRLKTYSDLVQRADNAKADAERSHREISERLTKIQATADQSVQRARVESEELKQKMIEEGKVVAMRIEEESKRTAQLELEKAKTTLRKDLLARALDSARSNMKKNLGTSEQKRLQSEFFEKILVERG